MAASAALELVMFLDVCRLYLESTESQRRPRGLSTLWAMVTFLRTEESAREFVRWCQYYRVPHLRERDDAELQLLRQRQSGSGPGRRRFRGSFRGLERKLLRVLNDYFYCGVCLPPGDF